MSNNQLPPLDKCCDCQKSFSQGEKHRAIRKNKKPIMNFCLNCWGEYTYEEEKWENVASQLNKCGECKKDFQKGEEYWELINQETKQVWNHCLTCWNKHTFAKKQWE